jgi:hypothetical protein
MATIIEFDRRYFREREALGDVPDMGITGFRVVPQGPEWRLQLHTERAVAVLKHLKRLYPLRTYRVLQTDEERGGGRP